MFKTYSPGPFTEPETDTLGQVYEKTVNAKIELDPVGKEDGDVDNDGDKDSTDKYLMKKRKAIGKAIAKQKTSKKESVKISNETDKVEVHKGVEEEAINEVLSKRDLHDFSQQLLSYSRKHGGIDKEYFEKIASIAAAGKIPTPDDVDNDTDPRDFVLDMMNRTFPKQIMKQYKGLSPSFDNYLNMNYDIHDEAYDMKIPPYANRKTAQAEKKEREKKQRERAGLDEARKSDYQLYHKDFSSAMQHAYAVAKKRGYTVDKDDIDNKVATGPRKPSSGKTNRYILGTDKKQNLHVQVANLDNKRFELNMYIESVEGKDMEISEKGRLKLEKVLENRKKFVEPENRAGDHGTDELVKNYKEMTPGEEVTEGNIVANSRDPFRIFEHMVHYLMGTSIKNIEDYTFYKMEDVDNHIRLENKEGALCSIYLADVQNFFDDKDISMEDFISMITEFGVKELTEKENSVIGDEGTPAVGKEKMGQGIYTTAPPKTFESMDHYSEFISKNVEIQKNGFVSTK